jgi:hypothetical protein
LTPDTFYDESDEVEYFLAKLIDARPNLKIKGSDILEARWFDVDNLLDIEKLKKSRKSIFCKVLKFLEI